MFMFCLFSYTFLLRTHFINIFICEGRDQIPTFCLFELWRDRHEKRSLHSFRFDTGSAFSARGPNCLFSIPTQLAFCQEESEESALHPAHRRSEFPSLTAEARRRRGLRYNAGASYRGGSLRRQVAG